MDERFELIKPYIENKDVLDIGCCDWCDQLIGENMGYVRPEWWLHDNIKKHAKNVLGVDLSEEGIKILKGEGYNVDVANAENLDLNQKFDVIIAGELIEHLSNLHGFLNSVKKHLNDDGLFVFTTPNVFYLRQILFLLLRKYPSVNPEHVCWFDEITIRQLLDRFGFSIVKLSYSTQKHTHATVREKLKDMPFTIFEKLMPFKRLKYGTIIVIAEIKNIQNER